MTYTNACEGSHWKHVETLKIKVIASDVTFARFDFTSNFEMLLKIQYMTMQYPLNNIWIIVM